MPITLLFSFFGTMISFLHIHVYESMDLNEISNRSTSEIFQSANFMEAMQNYGHYTCR